MTTHHQTHRRVHQGRTTPRTRQVATADHRAAAVARCEAELAPILESQRTHCEALPADLIAFKATRTLPMCRPLEEWGTVNDTHVCADEHMCNLMLKLYRANLLQ